MRAAEMGQEAVVKLLLDGKDVDLNFTDHDGLTPLVLAAWHGHEGDVKVLLDKTIIRTDSRTAWLKRCLSILQHADIRKLCGCY